MAEQENAQPPFSGKKHTPATPKINPVPTPRTSGCTIGQTSFEEGTLNFELSNIESRETSYQTAPLIKYNSNLQRRAADLFQRIAHRVGVGRAKQYKGSFSIFATTSQATAAKVVIHEAGKGKMNGDDPLLADGIYILVRMAGNQNARTRTIGVCVASS